MRIALLLSSLVIACGTPSGGAVDGGPDTSCGLDCAAQQTYGLIVNRCFEYSDDTSKKKDPPTLGALVLPVFTLDNKVKVLPVEYRQGGQLKMRDSFAIVKGELLLVRREFPATGQSVTYRDSSLQLAGVKWLETAAAGDQTYTTTAKALLAGSSGAGNSTDSSYRVTTAVPSSAELKTPLNAYLDGLKLLFAESPTDNGSDSRRIFVPNVGFVLIASPFSLAPGAQVTAVMLQRVREMGTPDAGAGDCSQGAP